MTSGSSLLNRARPAPDALRQWSVASSTERHAGENFVLQNKQTRDVDDASPIERQVPHILATRNHEELAMGAIATGGMRVLELVGKQ